MIGWIADMGTLAQDNTDFRRVVATGHNSQLTLMSLGPGEDIGKEIHQGLDEFVHIRSGTAKLSIGLGPEEVQETHDLAQGWAAFVPAGHWYNVTNTGESTLKLYSVCAPAAHHEGTVQATWHDAQEAEDREEMAGKIERGFAEAQGFGA